MTRIGLFSPARDSAPLPGTPIDEQGRNSREADGGVIDPAKDVDELQGQIGQLIVAFEQAQGRKPTPSDPEFWGAYNELIAAFGSTSEVPDPTIHA